MKSKILCPVLILLASCSNTNEPSVSWYDKGMQATDPKEKIECFTKSIDIIPTADAHWFRYKAKMEINDTIGLSDDLKMACTLDKKYAHYERGILETSEGNFLEALGYYTLALGLGFTDADVYLDRGYAKHQLMDYKGALDDYNKFLALNPENGMAMKCEGTQKVRYRITKVPLMIMILLLIYLPN
jgi:tetratricopeptide (TPR) repeat protein